jgi:hypothetical protein
MLFAFSTHTIQMFKNVLAFFVANWTFAKIVIAYVALEHREQSKCSITHGTFKAHLITQISLSSSWRNINLHHLPYQPFPALFSVLYHQML